ncbi:MAG: cytochrome P450 [Gaiellales bacterium]
MGIDEIVGFDAIPHPRPRPLIGDLGQFRDPSPHADLARLTQELGPIFRLQIPSRSFIVVSQPEAVAQIADDSRWDKMPSILMREIVGDGLVTAYTHEPNWGKANRLVTPAFTTAGLKESYPAVAEVGYQAVERLLRRDDFEDGVDVGDLALRVTLEAIGIAGFGHRFGMLHRSDVPSFIPNFLAVMDMVMKKAREPIPLQGLRRRRNAKEMAHADVVLDVADRLIAARRARGQEAGPRDALGRLLWDVDPITGEPLPEESLRLQVATLLIAGHETTSALMTWAIYYLTGHPEILSATQREIDEVLGGDIAATPSWEQVHRLDALDRVFMESLRLSPILPAFLRRPFRDEVLLGRYRVPAGTDVIVFLPALHTNPEWWDRPERFDPDRWLPERRHEINEHAYYPFGLGQRACVGRGFALLEARAVLGMILRAFDLERDPDYELHTTLALTVKPADLHVTAVPRGGAAPAGLMPVSAKVTTEAVVAEPESAPASGPVVAGGESEGAILIAYGSNGGTCRDIARRFADAAAARGFAVEVNALDEIAGRMPADQPVVIVTASYNGNAAQNAASFHRWLAASPNLQGVRAAVFGVGDPSWHLTYMRIPKELDEQLRAAGADVLVDRGEGDAAGDVLSTGLSWLGRVWGSLGLADAEVTAPAPTWVVTKLHALPATIAADNLLDMRQLEVVEARELQRRTGDDPSERSTHHIDLELPEGATYRAGDHLSVFALNSRRTVDRMLHLLGRTGNHVVELSTSSFAGASFPTGVPIAVRDLLRRYLDLQAPATRLALADIVARAGAQAPEELRRLVDADDASFAAAITMRRRSIADLLEDCGRPPFALEDLLAFATPLRARSYSISSSPLADPRRATITVGQVIGPARSGHGTYRGICSTHLLELEAGDRITAAISPVDSGFHLPADTSLPIIMVGAGTGLAPFRGFVQHRHDQRAMGVEVGPAMLIAGCRRSDHDRIYGDEWDAWAADGIVRVDWAYSREPGQPRQYVQDRLRANGEAVASLLAAGAHVYVCGDGAQMAPAVRGAFAEIGAGSAAGGGQELGPDRYHEDVWGGA